MLGILGSAVALPPPRFTLIGCSCRCQNPSTPKYRHATSNMNCSCLTGKSAVEYALVPLDPRRDLAVIRMLSTHLGWELPLLDFPDLRLRLSATLGIQKRPRPKTWPAEIRSARVLGRVVIPNPSQPQLSYSSSDALCFLQIR